MSNVLKDKAIEQVQGDKVICLHMKHCKSPTSTPWIALPDKAVLFRVKCNLGACRVASCLNADNETLDSFVWLWNSQKHAEVLEFRHPSLLVCFWFWFDCTELLQTPPE